MSRHPMTRRTFVKTSLLASAAGGAMAQDNASNASAAAATATAPAPGSAGTLPCGKIGDIQVSRLLLGGNLLTHYTHSRDLQYVYTLCAHYNTEAKIIETLRLAEQYGINTLVVHTVPAILDTLRKYRFNMGGKIQWIICPTAPVEGDLAEYRKQVKELADSGCEAIYLWGVTADGLIAKDRADDIARAVDVAKEAGLLSGVGAHDMRVVEACESKGVANDFYIKTFHHHRYPTAPKPEQLGPATSEVPGYWCKDPNGLITLMAGVKKPWIAFKVMAAGAIAPEDAFQYAFDNGADHILAGMFDFEIAQDAKIINDVLAKTKRSRPWMS